ncbi:Phytochrome A-associated F-box protein [Spatholobus suberectus]|nr:Phytochrome A-associated F-box protein [Spatholobus suberectus]
MGTEDKNVFSELTDDIVLNIFFNLEDDPRHWARLACVCTKFSSLIRDFCWKTRCSRTIPSDLLSAADPPLSLHKLAVCCPGLLHAGLHFDTSDFGLERDLGPDSHHPLSPSHSNPSPPPPPPPLSDNSNPSCWSLFDDLYYDTLYDASESEAPRFPEAAASEGVVSIGACKKRKVSRAWSSHLASGTWSLRREQGASSSRGSSATIACTCAIGPGACTRRRRGSTASSEGFSRTSSALGFGGPFTMAIKGSSICLARFAPVNSRGICTPRFA